MFQKVSCIINCIAYAPKQQTFWTLMQLQYYLVFYPLTCCLIRNDTLIVFWWTIDTYINKPCNKAKKNLRWKKTPQFTLSWWFYPNRFQQGNLRSFGYQLFNHATPFSFNSTNDVKHSYMSKSRDCWDCCSSFFRDMRMFFNHLSYFQTVAWIWPFLIYYHNLCSFLEWLG